MNQKTEFVDLLVSPDIPIEKPIYNHFMHMHGGLGGSTHIGPHSHLHMSSAPIMEFNGYIPVVHRPTYTDMGNSIHFNPSPVFIPAPSGVGLALTAICVWAIRPRR